MFLIFKYLVSANVNNVMVYNAQDDDCPENQEKVRENQNL